MKSLGQALAREIDGRIADENDSDLRYSEVPLKGEK